jgi:EAL domain-containing protein (putative c-di-GMP-specific phosphodiesterase class I)
MGDVDRWVISRAMTLWGASGHAQDLVLAINLSGLSLQDETLPRFIRAAMEANGIDARRVRFEITETAAVTHLARCVQFMREVNELGCSFVLDDFGSGMSSFSYLKTLPVEYLKIDGSFVRDILTDPVDRAFVEMINRVGQTMGKQTIAESVENEAIREAVRAIGVHFAQGYGIAEPRPLEEILEARRGTRPSGLS